jgi:hypothetical protein
MPLQWNISHDDELVHAIAVGEVNADDIQGFLGSVIAVQAMHYSKLFDITEVTALTGAERLSEVADTVRLYDKMKLGAVGPLAIVAGSNPQRVLYARAFERAATAQRPVQLFEGAAEARAWLLSQRTSKSQLDE